MKFFALALALVSSAAFAQVSYTNSVDLAKEHTGYKIDQAVYTLIPTKVEIREIPGCGGDRHPVECQETIVLESEPVVQVFVDYNEGVFRDPELPRSYVTFNFHVNDFSAEEIAELKKASPMWRLGGSSVRKAWAKKFSLETKLVPRTIQIVDVRRSTLCQIGESGMPTPGCVERLVYKDAQIKVRNVTVNKL